MAPHITRNLLRHICRVCISLSHADTSRLVLLGCSEPHPWCQKASKRMAPHITRSPLRPTTQVRSLDFARTHVCTHTQTIAAKLSSLVLQGIIADGSPQHKEPAKAYHSGVLSGSYMHTLAKQCCLASLSPLPGARRH